MSCLDLRCERRRWAWLGALAIAAGGCAQGRPIITPPPPGKPIVLEEQARIGLSPMVLDPEVRGGRPRRERPALGRREPAERPSA